MTTTDLLELDIDTPPPTLGDILLKELPNSSLSKPSKDFIINLLNNTSIVPHILSYITDLNTSIKPHHIPSFVKHIVTFIKKIDNKKRIAYDLLECIRFILQITLKPTQPQIQEIIDHCLFLLQVQISKPSKSCLSIFSSSGGENQTF